MVREAAHILIADDEETGGLSTAERLKREGYWCDCAQNVEDAGRLMSNSYDLFIFDMRMPDIEQLQFLQDIRARFPLLPILVVAGCSSLKTATTTLRLSFVECLLKPIEWVELSQAIALAVQRGQLARSTLHANTGQACAPREPVAAQSRAPVTSGPASVAQGLTWPLERYLEQARNQIDTVSYNVQQTVGAVMAGQQSAPVDICQFMACPRQTAYKNALLDTIEVLERTKHAFKSKDLGELRRRLESVLCDPDT